MAWDHEAMAFPRRTSRLCSLLRGVLIVVACFAWWGVESVRAVIISGEPEGTALADPREWMSILLLTTSDSFCSAVVVGPRTILTAARCLSNQPLESSASFNGASGDFDNRLTCKVHPNAGADFALCRTLQPLPVGQVERISGSSKVIAAGAEVTIVGYGCRNALRNFDGLLSVGRAIVQVPPRTQAVPRPPPPSVVLVGVVACSGDAGGGAFARDGEKRVLVGLIQSSDTENRTWIAGTANELFLNWARQWSREMDTAICGLDPDESKACTPAPQGLLAVRPVDTSTQPGVTLSQPTSAPLLAASKQEGNSQTQQLRRISFRPGDKMVQILQSTCGQVDDAYLDATFEYLARKGDTFTRDYVFNEPRTLDVPICPPKAVSADRIEVQLTESGKSLWTYFADLKTKRQLLGTWDYGRPAEDKYSPKGRYSPYYDEVFMALNPLQTNVSDLKPGRIILPLRRTTASAALRSQANEWFDPVVALQSSEAYCARPLNELMYPLDIAGLLDALSANIESRNTRDTGTARVVIVDSGLQASERSGSIFRGDIFYFNDPSAPAQHREPPDFEPTLENPTDAAHGTWVASAALGGPLLARVQMSGTGKPRIRIDPYRIHEERVIQEATGSTAKVIIPADQFQTIFDDLPRNPAALNVVNLSLKAAKPLNSLEKLLGPNNRSFLFVVASGNGIGDGKNNEGQLLKFQDEKGAFFPSAYGGRGSGKYNLIAVAALYQDDKGVWRRAKFSDYNPQIVEIGAPGCSVPVMHWDNEKTLWMIRTATGTSFAAPLVSFTAAIISSEFRNITAAKVKQRILASADLNPHLANCITDGRSLNVVKALSLRKDVIELRPPPQNASTEEPADCSIPATGSTSEATARALPAGKFLRGEIKFHSPPSNETPLGWGQDLPIRCFKEQQHSVRLMSILKIVPSFNIDRHSELSPLYPDLVYVARPEDEPPLALDCKLPDDVAIYFRQQGVAEQVKYTWNELRDIVLRSPEVRH
jgi:subtilase family protein/trypsin